MAPTAFVPWIWLLSNTSMRLGKRVLDQVLLLAALRHHDFDAVAALGAERLGEQRAVVDFVRRQDQARTRLVVIELGEERGQNLGGRQRFVGPRKIGTVAPVLPGAEEEHLDAGEAALLMQGKDGRLLDAAR